MNTLKVFTKSINSFLKVWLSVHLRVQELEEQKLTKTTKVGSFKQ
jgi:hypothetical protein